MSASPERRDFERIKTKTAMTLSYGVPVKLVEGLCSDISDNGIGVEAGSVIAIGTECHITLHDGYAKKTEFQALIEIKRISEMANGRYSIGAVILEKF